MSRKRSKSFNFNVSRLDRVHPYLICDLWLSNISVLAVFDNLDDGRDLKTVEKDLARSSDEKETAYNTINGLNNEQKSLNDKISRITVSRKECVV
jgi:septal ring factor EnvC (AmiA/AmiB activator)